MKLDHVSSSCNLNAIANCSLLMMMIIVFLCESLLVQVLASPRQLTSSHSSSSFASRPISELSAAVDSVSTSGHSDSETQSPLETAHLFKSFNQSVSALRFQILRNARNNESKSITDMMAVLDSVTNQLDKFDKLHKEAEEANELPVSTINNYNLALTPSSLTLMVVFVSLLVLVACFVLWYFA